MLDKLNSELGQSLQQTVLIYLSMDESKLKEALLDIEDSMIQQQQLDDQEYQVQQQKCNDMITNLNNDITKQQYEISETQTEIKTLQDDSGTLILQQKQRELSIQQEYLEQLEIERNDQLQIYQQQVKECDQILEIIQSAKFQYEKQVLPQLSSQSSVKMLSELHQQMKDYIKKLNKLINKHSYSGLMKIFIGASSQINKQPSHDNISKLVQLLTSMQNTISQNIDQLRVINDQQIQLYEQAKQVYISNIGQVKIEILELQQQFDSNADKASNLDMELQDKQQNIQAKQTQLGDKQQICNQVDIDYQNQRDRRSIDISLTSELIGLVERDIVGVREYYTMNGLLR